LDGLIAKEQSAEKIRELLELRDIALRQKWQERRIEEAQKQQEYERLTQDKKERTITIASSGTIAIGLGIMYSTSPLVGTFVLLLGLATLLRIPFDELYDNFLEFFDKIYERLSSIFPPKS
jgi:Flp pilus assembly protein TadB